MTARCIVTDLDRTLTDEHLVVDPAALDRIHELRLRGIRVVVATGRRFDDPHVARLLRKLDAVVAENGAVVHLSGQNAVHVMHSDFAQVARAALGPLAGRFDWGRVVGSGPRELAADASARLAKGGVQHAVEFNAQEVMLLPPRVDKATGAMTCLREWGIQAADVWAIGDGENDVALLKWAGLGAAPGNAAPQVTAIARVGLVASYSRAFLEFTEPLVLQAAAPR